LRQFVEEIQVPDTARYGVDAPGGIAGLIGVGAAGLTLSRALRGARDRRAASAVAAGSLVALTAGMLMCAYAVRGKYRLRDWLLDGHQWRGDEVVLDVGAGRGLMAVAAAKRVPRGRVIAADIWRSRDLSGNGADALLANAQLEGIEIPLEVQTADARALKVPDDSVDVVFSVLCLHNISGAAGRSQACREIARVLRPGGVAMIADFKATRRYTKYFRAAGMRVSGPDRVLRRALAPIAVIRVVKP
jgi:arsenite methyltransferase